MQNKTESKQSIGDDYTYYEKKATLHKKNESHTQDNKNKNKKCTHQLVAFIITIIDYWKDDDGKGIWRIGRVVSARRQSFVFMTSEQN